MLRWLTAHGFELGNHTRDHVALDTLDDEGVQQQLVLGADVIQRAVPGYRIRSVALPLGAMPRRARLASRGSWNGRRYGPYAVLLVGANPAASPYSRDFTPAAIPRIRTSHADWDGSTDYAAGYWLRELREPGRRFVSDANTRPGQLPARRARPPTAPVRCTRPRLLNRPLRAPSAKEDAP